MASKGSEAKKYIDSKIKNWFGADYVGSDGSNIYVMAPEKGDKIQICLHMSCPTVKFGGGENVKEAIPSAWEVKSEENNKTEITEKEKNYVTSLLEELGF